MKVFGSKRKEQFHREDSKIPNTTPKLRRASPREQNRNVDSSEPSEIRDDVSTRSGDDSTTSAGTKTHWSSQVRSSSPKKQRGQTHVSLTETLLDLPQLEVRTSTKTTRYKIPSPRRWLTRKKELRQEVDDSLSPVHHPRTLRRVGSTDSFQGFSRFRRIDKSFCHNNDDDDDDDAQKIVTGPPGRLGRHLTGPPRRIIAPQEDGKQRQSKNDIPNVLSSGSVEPMLPPFATKPKAEQDTSPDKKNDEDESENLTSPPRQLTVQQQNELQSTLKLDLQKVLSSGSVDPVLHPQSGKVLHRIDLSEPRRKRRIPNVLSSGSVEPMLPPRGAKVEEEEEEAKEEVVDAYVLASGSVDPIVPPRAGQTHQEGAVEEALHASQDDGSIMINDTASEILTGPPGHLTTNREEAKKETIDGKPTVKKVSGKPSLPLPPRNDRWSVPTVSGAMSFGSAQPRFPPRESDQSKKEDGNVRGIRSLDSFFHPNPRSEELEPHEAFETHFIEQNSISTPVLQAATPSKESFGEPMEHSSSGNDAGKNTSKSVREPGKEKTGGDSMNQVAERRPTSPVDFETADVDEIEKALANEPSHSFEKMGPPRKLEGCNLSEDFVAEALSSVGGGERTGDNLDHIDPNGVKNVSSDSSEASAKPTIQSNTDDSASIKTEGEEEATLDAMKKVNSESYEAFEALVEAPSEQGSVKGPPLVLEPPSFSANSSTEEEEEDGTAPTTEMTDSTTEPKHVDPESYQDFEAIVNAPSSSSAVLLQKDIPKVHNAAPLAPQQNPMSIINGIAFNPFAKAKKTFSNRVIETRVASPVNFEDVEAVEQMLKEAPTQSFAEQAPPTVQALETGEPKTKANAPEKGFFGSGGPWQPWLLFRSDTAPLENVRAKSEEEEEGEGEEVVVDEVEMTIFSNDGISNDGISNDGKIETTSSIESDVFTDFDFMCGYNREQQEEKQPEKQSITDNSEMSDGPDDLEVPQYEQDMPNEPSGSIAGNDSFSTWNFFTRGSNLRELKNALLSNEEKRAANLPGDDEEPNNWSEKAQAILPSLGLMLFSILFLGFLYSFIKHKFSLFDRDFFVDWERQMNVAFVGGAYLVINDIPRLTQALSNHHMTQNSVLHPSVGSVAYILETGNGMYYQWKTDEAFAGTHVNGYGFNVADYDFGLCTVKQLLYGQDQNIADGTYENDGRNPCIQDEYYLERMEETLSQRYISWDYVVIADQTKRMAVEEAREYTTEALVDSYAPMLSYSGAIPVILDTHAFWANDMNSTMDGFDIPSFQALIYDGAVEYAEALASVLPKEQAPIIAPAGLAFLLVYEDDESKWEKLIASDGIHASVHGSYLVACVIYATVYGHLPEKGHSTRDIEDLFAKSRKLYDDNIEYPTTQEASYYRKIARRAVLFGEMPASFTIDEEARQ
eukprot:scaffold2767_cov177-Amphora_coffeaeformis.AAC.79